MKMGFNKEQLKGMEPVPAGWYNLKVQEIRMRPVKDQVKNPGRHNLNIEFIPQGVPTDLAKRKIWDTLYESMANFIQDFVHGCGMPMEQTPDGAQIPGDFTPDPQNNKEYVYRGPLLGRVVKAEIIISSYQGKDNNKIKQYLCAVDACATKHPDVKHSNNHVKA